MAPQDMPDVKDVAAIADAMEMNRIKGSKSSDGPHIIIKDVHGGDSGRATKATSSGGDDHGGASTAVQAPERSKTLIRVVDHRSELADYLPNWRKWAILGIVGLVQLSMNFNTSLYSNAISGISEEFGVSHQVARVGAAVFLITYAFGCELWAPWSEELGRFWVLQASLLLVNVWQIPVATAFNIETVIVARALGGLSTAGGSITLGMVADMWDKEHHQLPIAFVVFTSVGGSVLGPIVGGFIEENFAWTWNIWVQLIFGLAVQVLHFAFVPETRSTILMDKLAKRLRAQAKRDGQDLNLWGPNEIAPFKERFSWTEIGKTWLRPFKMFITEPIVLILSLLSGFSDALIFMYIQSFGLVYRQWNFAPSEIGLAFLPFMIGYLIAWLLFIPAIHRNKRERDARPTSERAQFESRLWLLLWLAPCLPIGLYGFAWTSGGPPVPWIASMIFVVLGGIANYSIYMATIDYMVTAYGPFSASATGGNGWARDFLAGVLTCTAPPFYENVGGKLHLQIASTILGGIATILVAAIYVIYCNGAKMRQRSKFAQELRQDDLAGRPVGMPDVPSKSAERSKETLTQQFELGCSLEPTATQSMMELRGQVGFTKSPHSTRHNSPTRRSGDRSRRNSPSRRLKRPDPAPRATSMYHSTEEAAKITVHHPALLRPPQRDSPHGRSTNPLDTLPATCYEPQALDRRVEELRSSVLGASDDNANANANASIVNLGRGSRDTERGGGDGGASRSASTAEVGTEIEGGFDEAAVAAAHDPTLLQTIAVDMPGTMPVGPPKEA